MSELNSKKISREELIRILKELANNDDFEIAHSAADSLLLSYIDDEEITEAFDNIGKWYA
jgi:Glu-tRNA(Gln) amidotransferase subunit E-like FAD-binding protein